MALGVAAQAPAQGFSIVGEAYIGELPPAGMPLADAWVVMHEVHLQGGAPVDSARTDRNGRYVLSVSAFDSASVYLVSATFRGITYFTSALVPRGAADTAETLVVYDTSSTSPRILVDQRHVIVRVPDADGGRPVLEVLVLANTGTVTRITNESSQPVWRGIIPRGIVQFEVSESEVSPEAIALMGDTLEVTAPIPPGQKQLVLTYVLPAGMREFVIPVDQPIRRLTVLLEDTTAVVASGALEYGGVQIFEDAQFALYEGRAMSAGQDVAFRFSRQPFAVGRLWVVVVAATALAMLLALIRWGWGRGRRRSPVPVTDPGALARRIATLDETYERAAPGERGESAYREERVRLKAQLEEVLARAQQYR